jgi:hypothetical protein
MPFSLATLALTTQMLVAVADKVPEFDTRPSCRGGAESGIALKPDVDGCVRSETRARDEITRRWGDFSAADRTRCVETTQRGGPPSYVEVLTCLEMAQEAKRLPKDENTGLSRGLRR